MNALPTLTVAIIAQNEARNLAELLPSLGWADEVLVVDGGSRDGTLALARRHGCRVVERRFDYFAAQRNCALQHARGNWLLMLDADERPTPRLVHELRRRVGSESALGYHVPIRSRIFGRSMRYAGTQDDRPIRLVHRDHAFWTGDVHETCQVRGRVASLSAGLEHCTLPDVSAFFDKMHRYTALAARARVDQGIPPQSFEAWFGPPRELFRRLAWKLGVLDGPAGWAFCALSALSVWVGAREHRRQWKLRDCSGAGEHLRPCALPQGGLA
ncbi:MAG: glycosyltransferase family 2 protein [Planctomycetia bacterium]|nr:glycosyltransferase family 2 protein [Planctomycetia bacterium]